MQNINIQRIRELITKKKITTLEDIKKYLNASVRMTIIRCLRKLFYLTSYSHKGKYYTLDSIPKFSKEGLWNYNSVYFSKFGTLQNTCRYIVKNSESGYTVKELQNKLYANVKVPLLLLFNSNELYRDKFGGEYVYFDYSFPHRKQQIIIRRSQNEVTVLNIDKFSSHVITEELKAAIILFYSILDEKQRRLYAGLESLKIGHGGDHLISQLLKTDPETVSMGRKELIESKFEKKRIRKKGGGRHPIKKNSGNNEKNRTNTQI